MEIKLSTVIHKPISHCWQVLGEEFDQIEKWSSGARKSEGVGEGIPGAPCKERVVRTYVGSLTETLLTFDPEANALSYEITDGLPFFLGPGFNSWSLKETEHGSELNMHMQITEKGLFGRLVGPLARLELTIAMKKLCKDFKYYLERGK